MRLDERQMRPQYLFKRLLGSSTPEAKCTKNGNKNSQLLPSNGAKSDLN